MDEYINRAEAIKMIENDLPEVVYYRKEDAIACIECLPTADVATKSEVAREIFAEIEKHKQIIADCFQPVYTFKQKEFEELKKKYTEG